MVTSLPVGFTAAQTANGTGSGLAGIGAGGSQATLPQNPDVVIRSSTDFARISSGDVAVIPPDATIQMPVSKLGQQIPSGATVVSNGGTLVYEGSPRTGTFEAERMLVMKDNTMIHGVEIVGPIAGRSEPGPGDEFGGRNKNGVMVGITVEGRGVEITQSTVRGWPAANVRFRGNSSGRVTYSNIVGAHTSDRGYGVSGVGNSEFVVAASYLNRNRHSVEAGDSASYTVTDSVIGPDAASHSLDVHPPAGGSYVYRNLTVMSESGITIRQVPEGGAIVENVWFTRATPEQAIEQIDQVRVDNPSDSQTHRGSKIADAANGFGDFEQMRVSNIHFGSGPPRGVGAPASMPSPSQIPTAPSGPGALFEQRQQQLEEYAAALGLVFILGGSGILLVTTLGIGGCWYVYRNHLSD